jgi:hypothetical protein
MGCHENFIVHHDMMDISDVQYVGRTIHSFLQKCLQISSFLEN